MDNDRQQTAEGGMLMLVILFFCFIVSGCSESSIPDLSSAERKIVDSIYRDEMKDFRPKVEDLCTVLKDSLLPIYIDSMENARLAEIEKQLERIKNMK